jgi:hypothetical protein
MNQRGWLLLSAGLLAVLGAALWFSSRPVEQLETEPVERVTAPAPIPPPPPPARGEDGQPVFEGVTVPPAPEPIAAPAPAPAPASAPAIAPRQSATPRPPKNPVDPQQLEQETALLARAKEVLPSDPELALRRAADLRQRFPNGTLVKEAELVRLEALLRLGRRDEAELARKKLVGKEPGARKAVDRLMQDVRQN